MAAATASDSSAPSWRSSREFSTLTPFRVAVYELTAAVPRGRVSTYGAIARALGGTSAQAVGTALHHNPFAPEVPCHRVVKSGGGLGGFSGTPPKSAKDTEMPPELKRKRAMLEAEGVKFDDSLQLVDAAQLLEAFPREVVAAALARLGPRPVRLQPDDAVDRDEKPRQEPADIAGQSSGVIPVAGKRRREASTVPAAAAELSALTYTGTHARSHAAAARSAALGPSGDVRTQLSLPGTLGSAVRASVRSGALSGHTSGLAPGRAQANLVMLPRAHAFDFLLFCVRNPKPCPLLEVCEPGSPEPILTVRERTDVRTDAPRYCVWVDGALRERVSDVRHVWRDGDDWVAFLLGCSFSFEEALLSAGLPVRHLQQEAGGDMCVDARGRPVLAKNPRNVPMYKTNIPTTPAGVFHGPLVVSMRPMTPAQAKLADKVTAAFPRVHGRPVHWGDPAKLGIKDLSKPDYGDPVTIQEGEVPVFWACGVTPQAALLAAKLPLAITHAPGHMLVLDITNAELAGTEEIQL